MLSIYYFNCKLSCTCACCSDDDDDDMLFFCLQKTNHTILYICLNTINNYKYGNFVLFKTKNYFKMEHRNISNKHGWPPHAVFLPSEKLSTTVSISIIIIIR